MSSSGRSERVLQLVMRHIHLRVACPTRSTHTFHRLVGGTHSLSSVLFGTLLDPFPYHEHDKSRRFEAFPRGVLALALWTTATLSTTSFRLRAPVAQSVRLVTAFAKGHIEESTDKSDAYCLLFGRCTALQIRLRMPEQVFSQQMDTNKKYD